MTRRRRGMLIAAIAMLPLAIACGVPTPDAYDRSKISDPPAPTMKKADAENLARQQFDSITHLTGGTWGDWSVVTRACSLHSGQVAADGRWSLSANAHVKPPADKLKTALRVVHDKWQTQGWTISFDTDQVVTAVDLKTDLSVTVDTMGAPGDMLMQYDSPCYRPAQNENPAKG